MMPECMHKHTTPVKWIDMAWFKDRTGYHYCNFHLLKCVDCHELSGFPKNSFEAVRNSDGLQTIFLGDGSAICAKDKYLWDRHFLGVRGKLYYRSDKGDVRDCGDMGLNH